MSSIHRFSDDIAVVGWSCRLPGAKSVMELWSLLMEGRCAVTRVPPDRFSLERFGHPRRPERGKSYTWAAGVIDDLWGFDPSVFGVSPREAEQMDPQQRILLQLTWEALEDAGVVPSSLAKSDVGVYVGASQTDYGHAFFSDHAIADSHFGPGTALSILSNRISYIFDLRGPSLTVDTACSSSLVALHEAIQDLRSGRVATAIVAGSNVIASPASFIAFSQASMLSPTGLCQAFSAKADGFVRGEGAVVLVLRSAPLALAHRNPIHGYVLASDVNSDGRTNGISLPNVEAQEALLQRIYSRNSIDFNRLAFVEAHGTGTPVGDPIEATAIGQAIARNRTAPLPIGSIKTNIGHLECGSGLAGVLKALLALNHGILPQSLHCEQPNPRIDFGALNLSIPRQPQLLAKAPQRIAGVNSFGFGGTNAHVVVSAGHHVPGPANHGSSQGDSLFALSAETDASLASLASAYIDRVADLSDADTAAVAAAIAHRRELLSKRIVISSSRNRDVVRVLNAFVAGEDDPLLEKGTAVGRDLPVAFVYSGNGSQWVGMGVAAYRNNSAFQGRFDQIDREFANLSGWSLKEALFSDTLGAKLPLTSIAQPLIFAIQSSATAALIAAGLKPAATLGHSVGEVAAAEASGALDLHAAVQVIHFRSSHQELVRGVGRMAAVLASADTVRDLLHLADGIEIAAINSPKAVTIAGPAEALASFQRQAEGRGIALLDLDLDYPFHSALMAPIERELRASLKKITPHDSEIPCVSSVTGEVMPGSRFTGSYWWSNVREPVQFAAAVRTAAKLGVRYFIEVGPRAMLHKHIADSLQGDFNDIYVQSVLDRNDADVDPFKRARAKALVNGAQVNLTTAIDPDPGPSVTLPHYQWQKQEFRFKPTTEAIGAETERHPFAGARLTADGTEWYSHIDTELFPALSDHKVGEQTIFPGTGFLEVALAVARQYLESETATIANYEIFSPLDLTNGVTRELMTRVSPGSNTIEILSRPRLAKAGWMLHCRGKILSGEEPPDAPKWPRDGRETGSGPLYEIATRSGLHYGPAFRLLERAVVHDDRWISVQLAPSAEKSAFLLNPMQTDCSAHGLFTAFPQLRCEERGVTYIPVRLEAVALYRPHMGIDRALIEVVSKSERAIVANCYFYGADGSLVASVRRVRNQAIPIRRANALEAIAVVECPRLIDASAITGVTGIDASVEDVASRADALGLVESSAAPPSDGVLLFESWAMATAYEIVSRLALKGVVNLNILSASGRLPEDLRPWLTNILVKLQAAGLAKQNGDAWRLIRDASMPKSQAIIKAIAAEQPGHAAELLLAGALSGFAAQIVSRRSIPLPAESVVSNSTLNFYYASNSEFRDANEALSRLLFDSGQPWPKDRALRVLQIGHGAIMHALAAGPAGAEIDLTVFEPNRRRQETADVAAVRERRISVVDAERFHELGSYDLIVSVCGLHMLPASVSISDIGARIAPGGLLVAVEPQPSLFKDIVFGLDPKWFLMHLSDEAPFSPLWSAEQWTETAQRAGLRDVLVQRLRCGNGVASLIVAKAGLAAAPVGQAHEASNRNPLQIVVPQGETALQIRLSEAASTAGFKLVEANMPGAPPVRAADVVVLPPPAADSVDPVEALTQRCCDLKAAVESLGVTQARLWIVYSGALAAGGSRVQPVETGAWAFARTLANEYPKLDVRRIDLMQGMDARVAAKLIVQAIQSNSKETELHLGTSGIWAQRVESLDRTLERTAVASKEPATLHRRSRSGQPLAWQPMTRRAPQSGEVELEVVATGVNFRDLMWSMSLLPDDMLEDGYTGPGLGIECAGRVARIGPAVSGLRVGDRVMVFAGSAFSTHLTVPAGHAVKLPQSISCEAAATIPVAFVTAYYSLVTLAGLKRGEQILVHGGAGAVGMAAIQIARSRGATVIATAGSPAKRSLLAAMGVRHIFDSRSMGFVEDVRAVSKGGVDVVLNSLAGEAMERSIDCLRPFGRFVELGKRDYVFNTHIGLRPFRRNLSYFGVDVDQLIASREEVGKRIYASMMRQFEKGILTPLPYSVFGSHSVAEVFHLMQKSAHIGKLVVRPPATSPVRAAKKPLKIGAEGTHVVTGAFGGFGLEAVKWLIAHGARNFVLIGRSGATTPEAKSLLQDSRLKVLAEPCDVSDRRTLEKVFEKARATMPPIVGVLHAAMVLDDAVVANLDAERFHRVLAPKVMGARNLDQLTRNLALDYFVLFSSVTTLIGNPGQGNYVAANAYMEGLARRRRQNGLPALAIGWGPIMDVGVVARSERLQAGLQKLTGVVGMRAKEALDLMGQAMEQPSDSVELAAMTISPNDGAMGGGRLAVLQSPTYAGLVSHEKATGEGEENVVNLRAVAANEGIEAVRRIVVKTISSELARVLHAREEDISTVRPLGEIGLDSLMALELAMNLERRFGTQLPLAGASGQKTVTDFAEEITAYVGGAKDQDDTAVAVLTGRHHEQLDVAESEAVKQIMTETQRTRRLLS